MRNTRLQIRKYFLTSIGSLPPERNIAARNLLAASGAIALAVTMDG